MILIERKETNPFFNIAAEEYVLKNYNQDVLMVWESTEAVICGKHQNSFAEINLPYVRKNKIPVIRRISGGGTVFHCPGNFNISILKANPENKNLIDFKSFTQTQIKFLEQFKVNASFEGKNNLRVNGNKISGNSAHLFKNKSLHHGTLLFEADTKTLNSIINPSFTNYKDKSVKSVVTEVVNLSQIINPPLGRDEFKKHLIKFLSDYYHIEEIKSFSEEETALINKLIEEKYNKWDWNYAYSPDFVFTNEIKFNEEIVKCKIVISKGRIQSANFSLKEIDELFNSLIGKRFFYDEILQSLNELKAKKNIIDLTLNILNL